ncbi:rRNA methyltransferase [Paraliobacillus quinghaiensis]|uniref:rRNA methyltransferase n=1 Tax=Paraliobacillus quinghaiensis TaxID=470815 RepID=A0A917TT41_9BACI|nr:class I SAM-dependent methyltransferase [Paraliobacillus quinghaiensis]GGM36911.1 rRNA methyltransferase [Paraliobacillus quinghaiensis]
MLKRVLEYAHVLMQTAIQPGETAVDATCGNGNDTLILSQSAGNKGHVYAFDIQTQAIEKTKEKLAAASCTNVNMIHDSHENVDHYLPEDLKGKLAGAIFNLGYLPGSDKQVITTPDHTITAIDKLAQYLKPEGIIVCVVYYGHEGGSNEKNALLNHLADYDQKYYQILQYGFINQKNNPPFILAIEKKQVPQK